MFDHYGSGTRDLDPRIAEQSLEKTLSINGWDDRAGVVVIAPELEIWAFGDSAGLERVIAWREGSLDSWLEEEGFILRGEPKPREPKRCLETLLRSRQLRHSSALYGQIAREIRIEGCVDPAFDHLQSLLRKWFGGPAKRLEG
jgi:hypothetical protein